MNSREMFERAIVVVLQHEGGYIDHPADAGGPTNFGISERWNAGVDIENLTREEAVEIYWTTRWEPELYHLLPLAVAIKTFDLAVNMGKHAAVTCLQRALRAANQPVAIDGILGPQTAGAARVVCEFALIPAIRSEAAGEYRVKLVRDTSQAPFASGWIERAYS